MSESPTNAAPDPQKQRQRFQQLERYIRKEFRRFDLSERQRIIADVILDVPYGWGNPSVRIPKLDIFTELTGISRENVHTALEALYRMRIIEISIKAGGVAEYRILPNPDRWQAKPRQTRAQIKEALEWVKAYNCMEEKNDEFREALASVEDDGDGQKEDRPNFKDGADAILMSPPVSDLEKGSELDAILRQFSTLR